MTSPQNALWKYISHFAALICFLSLSACLQSKKTATLELSPKNSRPSHSSQGSQVDGTADGSGGESQKSTLQQIDDVIADKKSPHLGIRRRLRLIFHRLEFMRKHPSSEGFTKTTALKYQDALVHAYLTKYDGSEPHPAVFKVLDQIFDSRLKPYHQDIEALKVKVQDPPCQSGDGRQTLMAISDHDLCISRTKLSSIPPENLLVQILAVGSHEVAHLRGIVSEDDADLVRDFVLENQKFLIKGDSFEDLLSLENSISRSLLATTLRYRGDLSYQKEDRCLRMVDGLERLGSLSGILIGLENRDIIHTTLMRECVGIDPSTYPRKTVSSGPHSPVAVADAMTKVVHQIEKRRQQFMRIQSPLFSWHGVGYPPQILDNLLITNSLRSLLLANGTWSPRRDLELGKKLREQVTCTGDNEKIRFSSDNCFDEKTAPIPRDGSIRGKACALFKAKDSRGNEHEIYIVNGSHSINSEGESLSTIHDYQIHDLINLEFFLNPKSWREVKDLSPRYQIPQAARRIPLISGNNLMSLKNNVGLASEAYTGYLPFYELPNSMTTIAAILHPETTPEIKFELKLPNSYDPFWERIRYDEKGIEIRCWLPSAAN